MKLIIVGIVIINLILSATSAKVPKLDYKKPFVTFFSDENHRGSYYHHYLKRECTNLPSQYNDWASSINAYERCVYVCENRDCEGPCERIHGFSAKGIDRLSSIGMNDKISSIKYCYTFAERGSKLS